MGKLKSLGLVSAGVVAGVLVSLQLSAVAQREPRPALPYEEIRQFTDVFGAIKNNYVEPVEDKKLVTEAISGMLTSLDPHSQYLDADAFKDLTTQTQGEFGGLGMEIGSEDGFPKVIAPIEDTPAARAGVRAGDLIIRVDDKPTKGMSTTDVVKMLRGKPKTNVTVTFARKGESKPIVITLERAVIKVASVKAKLVEPGYAYLRITQFQESTAENLVTQFNKLAAQGQLKGIVLDLRNDPGGLLNAAIGVSAAFLPKGDLVVSTDGRTDDAKRKFFANPEDYLRGRGTDDYVAKLSVDAKKLPMVVLVNRGSASASEIVAGALQDHKRATVMGSQSFGKGSVQTILPLSATTAIRLTTARYFTPAGRSIQAKGITPDLLVDEYKDGDPFAEFGPREADLDHHLANPEGGEAKPDKKTPEQRAADAKRIEELLKNRKPVEYGSADDWQLQQALNQLKGKPVETAKPRPEGATTAAVGADKGGSAPSEQ
ncbi:S41 family peptidase [Derxia gummosa]|uniref:S41 family peptidase n=1 Tax=Derxia gummosa DSM 723 TaxID=1121388 RepID=A0A8B6XBS5_9BURK|nr:S41 family peptidase [Derxia gummosa]